VEEKDLLFFSSGERFNYFFHRFISSGRKEFIPLFHHVHFPMVEKDLILAFIFLWRKMIFKYRYAHVRPTIETG
jgi:hypothetical protein